MTTMLCPPVLKSFTSASDPNYLFNKGEQGVIADLADSREKIEFGIPGESCKTNLFFGFFFDGTKNNYVLGEAGGNQSNVARLYDSYPGQAVDGVLPKETNWEFEKEKFSNYYRVYAPGVASPFEEIGDTGADSDLTKGAGFGYLGEDRIKWALIQAINNVHRHFYQAPLLNTKETRTALKKLSLTKWQRRQMTKPEVQQRNDIDEYQQHKNTVDVFREILQRLKERVEIHWPDPATGKPRKIEPAQVKKIFISAFGFSRGAAQARAFTNWLLSLCELDAIVCKRGGKHTLGGFEVQFDFLGLFDTVASVGIANTLGDSLIFGKFDGHGAWADSEDSLRVRVPCVHLVAAHEVRRSFPVDSIADMHTLPAGCREVIFPGVHSDLGSGYKPLEQGRGLDPSGADMLARIPLIYMYRQARMAGVPLKLEHASKKVQNKFSVSESVIDALNNYLSQCKVLDGSLTQIMREQGTLQMLWHKARRKNASFPLENIDSFKRAITFDQNDLRSANEEFEDEIKRFEKWRSEKGKDFQPQHQKEGFGNNYLGEWEELATAWNNSAEPPSKVLDFFDNYVHDSHAWFKLQDEFPDNEPDLQKKLIVWEERRIRALKQAARQSASGGSNTSAQTAEQLDGLTDDQRQAAKAFAETKQTPRMRTMGRESDSLYGMAIRGGYLRYRKVYAGADEKLMSKNELGKSVEVEAA